MEAGQLAEADLGALGVVHEPPGIAGHSGEADVGADDEVAEEQPATDEGLVTLTRATLHDVVIRRVERQGGGGETVGDEVDPEELNGDKSLGHAKSGGQEDGDNLTDVGGDQVADELLGVVVDGTTLLDGDLNGGEVAVGEDHVGGQLRDISSGTHGNANIGLLESGGIVDTVASHGNDLTGGLEQINKLGLVARFDTRE